MYSGGGFEEIYQRQRSSSVHWRKGAQGGIVKRQVLTTCLKIFAYYDQRVHTYSAVI